MIFNLIIAVILLPYGRREGSLTARLLSVVGGQWLWRLDDQNGTGK